MWGELQPDFGWWHITCVWPSHGSNRLTSFGFVWCLPYTDRWSRKAVAMSSWGLLAALLVLRCKSEPWVRTLLWPPCKSPGVTRGAHACVVSPMTCGYYTQFLRRSPVTRFQAFISHSQHAQVLGSQGSSLALRACSSNPTGKQAMAVLNNPDSWPTCASSEDFCHHHDALLRVHI